MLTVNFIGCGRLGKTIARLIYLNKAAKILGIVNTSIESSAQAVSFIGQGYAIKSLENLPKADITFITTKDEKIHNTCNQLIELGIVKPASLIIHCSGSLSSSVLESAKKENCLTASIHPVRSFANPTDTVATFKGTYCSFEGNHLAYPIVKKLFEKIGGIFIEIKQENKKKYHAATVMANNYLVTLHYVAVKNLVAAGIDEKTAHALASTLMNDAFKNIESLSHPYALTGPIQRGDINTVKEHMESLKNDSITSAIYASLGYGTLELTTHSADIKIDLAHILKPC